MAIPRHVTLSASILLRSGEGEEAYELLDAKDLQSIVAGLADIREVVDLLIQKLKVLEKEVAEEQTQKRHKLEAVVTTNALARPVQ